MDAARPVWLFSLDSENFHAAPLTTGALIAFYRRYGAAPDSTAFAQLHFESAAAVDRWLASGLDGLAATATAALAAGLRPVAGLSVYTWNAAEFLRLAASLRAACPGITIIAGGPHVQVAEDYLGQEAIDVVVLGEGERTFQQWLDAPPGGWHAVDGLAWLEDGAIRRSAARARETDLAVLPSPLEVVALSDADGRPLYDAVSYETTRGCPYRCAFCEWGTGAIGTTMLAFPPARIARDFEAIVRAGIANIWLADSNFGALRADLETARLVCELKERHGLPRTFATSWSKKHNARVQEIALLLHRHRLLPFYQLALQTLTPRALELCHRENMAANDYEPIARRMAEQGIPIAGELIWGLPGDDLASFEANLDRLLAVFPNINIFGYTLLPGTEFHARRIEYALETRPVAGYGKARGEYVVGCMSFDRAEGEEGYFLLSAHLLLNAGRMLCQTLRYLALGGSTGLGELMRAVLDALLADIGIDARDRMQVYEDRAALYLRLLREPQRCATIAAGVVLARFDAPEDGLLRARLRQLLALDALLCPRHGEPQDIDATLAFDARPACTDLAAMRLPSDACFDGRTRGLRVHSPGGLGVVLLSPEGGDWLQARFVDAPAAAQPELLATAAI